MSALISQILSSTIEKSRLILKILRSGSKDSLTPFSASPFGIDARPIKGMKAVYMETANDDEPVLVGYINENSKAGIGEVRFYSLDSDGNEKNFIHIKNDGKIDIGGSGDNMVRFSKLEDGYNELKTDFNNLVTKWNAFAGAYLPGGPTVQGLPPSASTASSSSATIADAKIDEIKTS